MAPEMDQFYRSTMAIYKSIMEQFNPALENLVYLGNNYLRAFHALSEAAEVYFSAIQKIGEQALQSSTSQILGEILVQMSDTQRHLNSDLEVVVQTFHGDLLQHMEKNTKLDMQFIKDSRQHYEIEYRHRAANLEKCMSELWRMERKRDKNAREMKESVNRLHAQMQAFVSESQRAAELEEKRRYRFLAEKHLLLSNTFLQFFGRCPVLGTRSLVLHCAWSFFMVAQSRSLDPWGPVNPRSGHPQVGEASSLLLALGHFSVRSEDAPPPGLLSCEPPASGGRPAPPWAAVGRHGRGVALQEELQLEQSGPQARDRARSASQLEPERRSLPRTPSASSLYTGSAQRSRSNSFGERPGGGGGALRVRALVSHSEGANHTLLRFAAGDVVEVLVPEAQNGWLYGKLEGSSASGWFPEAYVKPLEEVPVNPMTPLSPMTAMNPMSPMNELSSRSYPLRGSHSLDDLLDRSGHSTASPEYLDGQARSRNPSRVPSQVPSCNPSPTPTPLPGSRRSSMGSMGVASDVKKLMAWEQHPPELFPRGTNPFATVKLRPTVTNDRSAPLIR
ncbi:Brain-specific angiogenesis inhibitor 1-associated protein 2-like protein 2 [Heterocephalus glaber]|uniref:BAR/IMD domain-containing adapter protein 2-like 2 n=1 Tax=Heterocephalus glaber TaxID=10181 RepID=G5AYS5_HETGA|nr:Brain-specific angiogenesis inhibitor 1-associated protein 2-like protein 2 [Heterocephalus glaber]